MLALSFSGFGPEAAIQKKAVPHLPSTSSLTRPAEVADEKRKQEWREKGYVRQKQLFPKNRLRRFKKDKRDGDRKDFS